MAMASVPEISEVRNWFVRINRLKGDLYLFQGSSYLACSNIQKALKDVCVGGSDSSFVQRSQEGLPKFVTWLGDTEKGWKINAMRKQIDDLIRANAPKLPPFNNMNPDSIVQAIKTLGDEDTIWNEKMILGATMNEAERLKATADAKKKKDDDDKAREIVEGILAAGGPITRAMSRTLSQRGNSVEVVEPTDSGEKAKRSKKGKSASKSDDQEEEEEEEEQPCAKCFIYQKEVEVRDREIAALHGTINELQRQLDVSLGIEPLDIPEGMNGRSGLSDEVAAMAFS